MGTKKDGKEREPWVAKTSTYEGRVPQTTGEEKGRSARNGDILGCARVSTADQDASGQKDRLADACAIRVFTDVASGARWRSCWRSSRT